MLPEHTKYHSLGPQDISWGKENEERVMTFAVTRQSSAFGEQTSMECPVFASDSREMMMNRIHMCYSILQERMEDENKVTITLEGKARERAKEIKLKKEAQDRNQKRFEAEKKEINRKAHAEKWKGDRIEKELEELTAKFFEAQKLIDENPIEAPVLDLKPSGAVQGA
jgi:hypothetical protein